MRSLEIGRILSALNTKRNQKGEQPACGEPLRGVDSNLTNLIREWERLLMARGCGFLLNGTTVSGRSVHVV